MKHTRLLHLHKGETLESFGVSGISLHCHTQFSKENLDFLPFYAQQIPIIGPLFRSECKSYREREGRCIDFDTAYWTPPLTPEIVYKTEKVQISDAGLEPIVSITDHDCIDANLTLNESEPCPISMEWTVPFKNGFFHVGVHNLPPEQAVQIKSTLLAFTFDPALHTTEKLDELFQFLTEMRGVLIILNHPIWDIERIGQELHRELLDQFLKMHGKWMHALEVNGFRTWSENAEVIAIGEALNIPIVAGGDRHGCRPNTVINVSSCSSMDEYAADIRLRGRNTVVLMPEYERPLCSRQLESFSDILRTYPELPAERTEWMQRVFFDIGDERGLASVREHGMLVGPLWLRAAINILGVMGSPSLAVLFRFARRRADRVPRELPNSFLEPSAAEDLRGDLSSEPVV